MVSSALYCTARLRNFKEYVAKSKSKEYKVLGGYTKLTP